MKAMEIYNLEDNFHMTPTQVNNIRKIYNQILIHNPLRLDYLASIYRDESGLSDDIADGLDAIINFVIFGKYSEEEILYKL